MSKHVLDHPRTRSGVRLARFVRIARAAVASTRPELGRRARLKTVARVPVYLRIARQTA